MRFWFPCVTRFSRSMGHENLAGDMIFMDYYISVGQNNYASSSTRNSFSIFSYFSLQSFSTLMLFWKFYSKIDNLNKSTVILTVLCIFEATRRDCWHHISRLTINPHDLFFYACSHKYSLPFSFTCFTQFVRNCW